MAKSTATSLVGEFRRCQKKHGEFEAMELLVPDLHAFLKGKRIRQEDFEKVCRSGFWFCGGATLLTVLGETVNLAARLTARFSQGRDAQSVTVTSTDRQGRTRVMDVRPISSGDIPQEWYI